MEENITINSVLKINDVEVEFYDYKYKEDNEVFFDVLLIDSHPDQFASECRDYISTFWAEFIQLMSSNDDKAKTFFENLKEINWTCMGLSVGEPRGKGVSGKLSKKIYESIKNMEIFKKAKVGRLIELEIFVNNVNKDRISDIITSIILLPLSEYTERVCNKHNLQKFLITERNFRIWNKDQKRWEKRDLKLLFIDEKKLLLYPKNIVARKMNYKKENFFGSFMYREIRKKWLKERKDLVKTRKYKQKTVEYIPNEVLSSEIKKCIKESGLESRSQWIIKMFNDGIFDHDLLLKFYEESLEKLKKRGGFKCHR